MLLRSQRHRLVLLLVLFIAIIFNQDINAQIARSRVGFPFFGFGSNGGSSNGAIGYANTGGYNYGGNFESFNSGQNYHRGGFPGGGINGGVVNNRGGGGLNGGGFNSGGGFPRGGINGGVVNNEGGGGSPTGFQADTSCPSDINKSFSFNYSLPNGPPHWGDLFENCSNYRIQSPINIITENTVPVNGATGLNTTNFDKPITKILLRNVGYTVDFTPKDGVNRSVTFNGATYPLKRFIIRYGEEAERNGYTFTTLGSDHRVNGKRYTAEVHLVFGPEGDPNNDNLIVSRRFKGSYSPDMFIDSIIDSDALKNIKYKGDSYERNLGNDNVNLSNVFDQFAPFYAYKGSLSTPPCTPVIWLILKELKIINFNVLIGLTHLHSVKKDDPNADKCFLINNSRRPQPLFGRTVYSYGDK